MYWLDILNWGIPIIFGILFFIANIFIFPSEQITLRRSLIAFIVAIILATICVVIARMQGVSVLELALAGQARNRLFPSLDYSVIIFTYAVLSSLYALIFTKAPETDV
jgi:ABC-type Fe3+-siderophore transport system permease subunit